MVSKVKSLQVSTKQKASVRTEHEFGQPGLNSDHSTTFFLLVLLGISCFCNFK